MSKLDAKHYATKEYRYWVYSPEGDGMLFFRSPQARDEFAASVIPDYMDGDNWTESVDQVCCGVVTHLSTEVDRQERPDDLDEEGIAGDGTYWDSDCTHRCNYKMLPLPSEPFTQE